MVEKYYTPEQLEWLKERAEMFGEEHIRAVEAEWPQLIDKVRIEMEKGTDPADERVQTLARRWEELVNEFTGGKPEIERAVSKLYEDNPPELGQLIDPRMREYMDYVTRALKASKNHKANGAPKNATD